MTAPNQYDNYRLDTRTALFHAQEVAAQLGENNVATEHLLLALLEKDAETGRIMTVLGIQPSAMIRDIERMVTRGHGKLDQDMQITPYLKRALDLAVDEAARMEDRRVTPGCLLSGLARVNQSLATNVLLKKEATASEIRAIITPGGPLTLMELNDAIHALSPRRRRVLLESCGTRVASLPEKILSCVRLIVRNTGTGVSLEEDGKIYFLPIPDNEPRRYTVTVPLSLEFTTISSQPLQ